jgi:hypothetical protein
MQSESQSFLTSLYQTLNSSFSLEELRTFCLLLGVDVDNLSGSGKAVKIRELILWTFHISLPKNS